MQLNAIIALACATKALQRPRVIIAPAQFGVPKDYDDLSALLRQRGRFNVLRTYRRAVQVRTATGT